MLSISHKPMSGADRLSARERVRLWRRVHLLSRAQQLRTETVEPRHRPSRVDVAELGRESKRQHVQSRVRVYGKLSETTRLRHAGIVPPRETFAEQPVGRSWQG